MATKKLEIVITADAGGASRVFKGLGDDADSLGGKVSAFSKVYSNQLLLFGGAAVAGLGMAAKSAIDFESAMAGVAKTLDPNTEQMGMLTDGIRDMAKEIPATTTEIAAVAEAAGQLGIEIPNVLGFTRTMIDLGETTNLSATEAASSLAKLANVMQMPQTEFDRLGSTVVALGNNMATTEADIVEFGTRIAGAGKLAGLTESDVLSIGAAFSSVGIQAEAGGTAVQKVLLAVTAALAEGGDELEDFGYVAGVSGTEFKEIWENDASQGFTMFVQGLATKGDEAIGILDDLGLGNERTRAAFLSLASAGGLLVEALDIGSDAWFRNTALTDEAATRYDTTAAKLDIFKNQASDLAITVGDNLLPAISGTTSVLGTMADGFSELPGFVSISATAMTGFVGVGSLALGVYGKLQEPLRLFKENLTNMGSAGTFLANNLGKLTGAAIGVGAALAAYSYVQGINAEKSALAASRAEEYTQAIENQSGALEDNVNAATGKLISDSKIGDILLDTTGDFALFGEAIVNNKENLDSFRQAWADFGAFGDKGLNAAVSEAAESGDAFAQQLIRLRNEKEITQDEFQDLALTTQSLSQAYAEGSEQARINAEVTKGMSEADIAAANATGQLAGEIGRTTQSAEDAEKAFDDVVSSIKDFFNEVTSGLELSVDFEAAIDDLAESISEHGNAWNADTEAGRANISALIDAKDAAVASAAGYFQQTQDVEGATAMMYANRDSMIASMRAAGASEEAIAAMIAEMGLTPSDIETQFRAPGLDWVDATATNLNGTVYVLSGGRITIPTSAPGAAESARDVERLERAVRALSNVPQTPWGLGLGFQISSANGNIFESFAAGGFSENHVAQISRGTTRVWAEPETGGEAYIPLAPSKRDRSMNILRDVMDRFGVTEGGSSVGVATTSMNVVVNMPPGSDGEDVVNALRRYQARNGPLPVAVA